MRARPLLLAVVIQLNVNGKLQQILKLMVVERVVSDMQKEVYRFVL